MTKVTCEKCKQEFNTKKLYIEHLKGNFPCSKKPHDNGELIYSKLSLDLTKKIDKKIKKNNGIYFTPPKTINKNLDLLQTYIKKFKTVLEPSCGSCEYILKLREKYSNVKITGIEYNKTIYESIKELQNEKTQIINGDFLVYKSDIKYDLIIGNPPYFVLKKNTIDKSYYDYFDGRPNIFIIFIIKSLLLLNENGILSFVLPKSFLNCLYYDKTRKYIKKNYEILKIIECDDDYIETQQETIIIIVRNNRDISKNHNYYLEIGKFTIFGEPNNIEKLKELYVNSHTLNDLGFKVSVGNVVWNQCKKSLTNDSNKTLLIYSSNIKNKKLEIKKYLNEDKKNYIDKKGSTEPLLVINRGYGVGKYIFNYCIINERSNIEYLVENHLICIKYIKSLEKEQLIEEYKKIIKSFENPKTQEFIRLYFGNNAINTTELNNILPMFV